MRVKKNTLNICVAKLSPATLGLLALCGGLVKAHNLNVAPFYLRKDAQLQVRLTLQERDPRLSNVLGLLEQSTKMRITVAPNLTTHDPALGKLQLKSTHAYALMEFLAQKHLKNGRWKKTADGYTLHGESTVSLARSDSVADSWTLWHTAAGVSLIVVGGAFFFICGLALKKRFSRKKC